MVTFNALFFFITTISTLAKPVHSTLAVREQSQAVPQGFTLNGPASPDTTLDLRFALTSNNLTGLETILYAVSTPGNKLYGQYLTKEEVDTYMEPNATTKSAVQDWLNANDIEATSISLAGGWFNFTIPVSKANDLFHANFSVFTEQATGEKIVRTLSYSIPNNLESYVRFVYPATAFPIPSLTQPVVAISNSNVTSAIVTPDAVPPSCGTIVPPDCILGLYGIPRTVGPQSASRIAVPGFGQYAQEADLAAFLRVYRPDLTPPPSFGFQSVAGGVNPQNPDLAGEEANLDIQYTIGIAGGVPVTYYSIPRANILGYLDFVNYVYTTPNTPQVVSVSYSFNERDLVNYLGTAYLEYICDIHMSFGARGISFLYNTGDWGVEGSYPFENDQCPGSEFVPTFPSTCPYVTSVGSTRGFNPEVAAEFSTGGFSNIFPIPPYQSQAVPSYLNRFGSLYPGKFNRNGRGFPDVSAQGQIMPIYNASLLAYVVGTSVSTPIFASVIGQVNALRLQRGQGVLGFLNPKLYSTPGLLTDVTGGNNPGCGTSGFEATAGWDPVTGLGTPIFSAINALP